jgi:hypothetical protein
MKRNHFSLFFKEAVGPIVSLTSICAKHFILWKIFTSYPGGEFKYSNVEYDRFSEYLESVGGNRYQRNTVDVAIAELRRARLIIRASRGQYYINPEFIWIGKIIDRPEAIKRIRALEKAELEKIKEETVA